MHPVPVAAPPSREWTRRAALWLIGAALLVSLAVGAAPVQAAPPDGTTAISLQDDAGGAALFRSVGLHPGRTDHACVGVSATGFASPSSEVRLNADVGVTDLAPYLLVTVERGTVGRSGDCSTFTGEQIWSGTLAQFPAGDATGIGTGWRPALVARAVYRFGVTVTDDSRAQGRQAAATFVWTSSDAGTSPESVPRLPPPPGTDPGPAVTGPEVLQAPPGASPPATSPSGGSSAAAQDVIEAPPMQADTWRVERVAETALALVRDGHFPAVLAFVSAGFLALQSALDRRDPKLALARVRQDLCEFQRFPVHLKMETT